MFLDELFDPFYQKLALSYRSAFSKGQFFKTPVLYSYENAEVWRPSSYDGTQTAATDFRVTPSPGDAFKSKTPMHTPRLEFDEEFPVLRAKVRPVVLLVPSPPPISIRDVSGGGRINRHLCLVAPCYSVVDRMGREKYPSSFLERVRKLEFPQFMFLPQDVAVPNDSLLRLDSIQHVFHNALEPAQWALADEVREILLGQMEFFMTGRYSGNYQVARELLLEQS